MAIGHDPSSTVFKGQIDMCPAGHIAMFDRTQATSVSGVFAAGDVEDNRYRQAVVASGHGVSAALDAIEFLNEIGFDETIAMHLQQKKPEIDLQLQEPHSRVQQIEVLTDFEQIIAHDKVVIVDFFADYCPSCMQMLPVFNAVSVQFDEVTFVKIDADKGLDIMQKHVVHKVPYLLVFKDGKLAARYRDIMSKKELHEFVQRFV